MPESVNSLRFDLEELSSPRKELIRAALRAAGDDLADSDFAVNVKLQKGGGVSALFEDKLLQHPQVNRFEKRYATVSALCQRWLQEHELACREAQKRSEQRRAVVRPISPDAPKFRCMAELRSASRQKRYTVLALFAGGGGSSLGQLAAGGRVVLANEFVPAAAATYRRNFPDTVVDERDIRQLLKDSSSVLAMLRSAGLALGNLDIVDGSPPCSEFSVAGNGIADPTIMKNYSDTKQRDISGLPIDFALLARTIQPRVVMLENVPTLATRGKSILDAMMAVLGEKYFSAWRILNANHFGVAQSRRRLFLIAVRKDVASVVGIESNFDVGRVFPNRSFIGASIRDAFMDLVQSPNDLRPWVYSARTSSLERDILEFPKNPDRLTRRVHIDPTNGKRSNFSLTRCSWNLPAPTLTVTGQQPSGLAGAIHPDQDRKFTIPELKRLTGLPDDFTLTGTIAQAAERICRMVPPPLTQAIAESIYERVLQPYREAIHEKC